MAKVMRFERSFAPAAAGALDNRIGTDIARALDAFGDDVASAVDPMIQQREANQIRTTMAEGGTVEPSLGLTPIQRARNVVAQQGHLDRVGVNVASEVTRLHQEFSGQRLSDPENFAKALDSYAQSQLDAVPEGFRGAAMQHYQQVRGDAVTRLSEASFRNEDERNLKDSAAADDLDTNLMMKAARDGNEEEANKAAERMAGRRMALIEAGIIGEDFAKADAARLMDMATGERLYGEVLRGGGPSLEEVEAGKGAAAGLSLKARDALAADIKREIAHSVTMENRAETQRNKALAAGNRDLNALTYRLELGLPMDDAQQARLKGYSAGELAADPVQIEQARAAGNVYALSRKLATAPVEQVEAFKTEISATEPTTIEGALTKKKTLEKIAAREAWIARDPTDYAIQNGIVDPVVFPAELGGIEFDVALRQAADNVGTIRAVTGQTATPLTKDQTQQLATALAKSTPANRVGLHSRINEVFGEDAMAIHESLNTKGAVVDAAIGRLASEGAPDIARDVAEGQEALDLGLVKKPEGVAIDSVFAESGIPAAFEFDQPAQDQLRRSALALAAKRAGPGGDVATELPQALRDVGGNSVPYRDRVVALPPGVVDAGEFGDRIESVDDGEIIAMGGSPEIGAAIRSGDFYLQSLGNGQYGVVIGTSWAQRPDGGEFILDFNKITPKSPARGTVSPLGDSAGAL